MQVCLPARPIRPNSKTVGRSSRLNFNPFLAFTLIPAAAAAAVSAAATAATAAATAAGRRTRSLSARSNRRARRAPELTAAAAYKWGPPICARNQQSAIDRQARARPRI